MSMAIQEVSSSSAADTSHLGAQDKPGISPSMVARIQAAAAKVGKNLTKEEIRTEFTKMATSGQQFKDGSVLCLETPGIEEAANIYFNAETPEEEKKAYEALCKKMIIPPTGYIKLPTASSAKNGTKLPPTKKNDLVASTIRIISMPISSLFTNLIIIPMQPKNNDSLGIKIMKGAFVKIASVPLLVTSVVEGIARFALGLICGIFALLTMPINPLFKMFEGLLVIGTIFGKNLSYQACKVHINCLIGKYDQQPVSIENVAKDFYKKQSK